MSYTTYKATAEPRAYTYQTLGKRAPVQEDAFELPPPAPLLQGMTNEQEYAAVWGTSGEALLVRLETTRHTLASFDTMADAQRAAQALNNHEGL